MIFAGIKITNEMESGMFLKTARLDPSAAFRLVSSSTDDDRQEEKTGNLSEFQFRPW